MSELNNIHDYHKFCNAMFNEWKENQLNIDELSTLFQMDYAPEPYFNVKNGDNPLYMLLTNPGDGMDFQKKSNIVADNYQEFSNMLITQYTSDSFQKGAPNAYRRLQKSIDFTEKLGYNALVNIETIPFHSASLDKEKALNMTRSDYTLFAYSQVLKNFLLDKPVLIVSACSSAKSITKLTLKESDWLTYQMDIAGIDFDTLEMKTLTKKDDKVTSAIFSHGDKHITLMMGSNNLPNL